MSLVSGIVAKYLIREDRRQLEQDTLVALARIPTEGILAWTDITPATLHETLKLVGRGIRVQSAAAQEVLAAADRYSDHPLREKVSLTDREQEVLRAMGCKDTQKDVADYLQMGERTLHDVEAVRLVGPRWRMAQQASNHQV